MNVLIIGLGSIALKHIHALKLCVPNVRIYALRSGKGIKNENGVKNIYSYQEIDCSFDFVIVSNPTSMHFSTLKEVVKLNCPLFIEKPAIDNLEHGNILDELFTQKGIVSYVGFNLRFLPCLKYLKTNIEKGMRINEVNVYCGSYLPDWRPGIDFRENYSANKEMGGGVHLDLIHELDYIYWFFGKPSKIGKSLRSSSSLAVTSVDYANYCLSYDQFSVNVILNYYRRDAKRSCEIILDGDTWYADLLKNRVSSFKQGELFYQDFNNADLYTKQMDYFITSVVNKRESINTFQDSMNVLEICLNEPARK